MRIMLKDGSVKEYGQPMSAYEIAADISEGLARVACAAWVDGKVVDLRTVIDKAQQERESGACVLVVRMNKNKKFQKEQLATEGYTQFREFYKNPLK